LYDDYCVGWGRFSILKYKDGTLRHPQDQWSFKAENNFILKYAKFAIDKMKGCGCEEYFGDDRKIRSDPEMSITGRYIKEGNKLFFIKKKYNQGPRNSFDKIEIVQGDKCNVLVGDLIGKEVRIDLYEKLKIKNGKIDYINACKNPVQGFYKYSQ
jgi:hypothetical protein